MVASTEARLLNFEVLFYCFCWILLVWHIETHRKGDVFAGRSGRKIGWVVIPYVSWHNLEKIGSHCGIDLVFSAPGKLGCLCARTDKRWYKRWGCNINHRNRLITCHKGALYKTPLSCGCVYIGQMGRCINDMLREHFNLANGTPSQYMSVHCCCCACKAFWDRVFIEAKHKEKTSRELHEAFLVHMSGAYLCNTLSLRFCESFLLAFIVCVRFFALCLVIAIALIIFIFSIFDMSPLLAFIFVAWSFFFPPYTFWPL